MPEWLTPSVPPISVVLLFILTEVGEMGDRKPDDTRSFILKRAVLDEVRTLKSRLGAQHAERVPALPARLVQTRYAHRWKGLKNIYMVHGN